MSYALFINRNDIIKNSPLQGAIDADALLIVTIEEPVVDVQVHPVKAVPSGVIS